MSSLSSRHTVTPNRGTPRASSCRLSRCNGTGKQPDPTPLSRLRSIAHPSVPWRRHPVPLILVRNQGFIRPTAAVSFEDSLALERLHERAYGNSASISER